MKLRSAFLNWGIPVLALVLLVVLAAWQVSPQKPTGPKSSQQDTIPAKKRIKSTREAGDKDLDKELRELDRAKEEIENLSDRDWDNIKREIEESIKKIDLDKIKLEIERSLKEVDLDQIQKEIDASLRKIDFDKIDKDIERSMKEVERSLKDVDISDEMKKAQKEIKKAQLEIEGQLKNKEWRKEVERELEKVNSKEIEKALDEARREVERVHHDLKLEKLNMTDELEKAGIEIDKAKKELEGYQEMIYSMEKDGLLDTRNDYKIEYNNNGELFINGKKQTGAVTSKFKKYFKSNKDKTTITKEDGDFNIDID